VPAAPAPGWGTSPGLPEGSAAVAKRGPRWTLVGGVIAFGVLVVVLAVLVVPLVNRADPMAGTTPGGPATTSVPSPSPSASGPKPTAQPTVTAEPYGKKPPFSRAKVKGPVWAKGDDTYRMHLPHIGLVFRTAPKWGCLRSDKAAAPNIRWTCIDEGGGMDGAALTIEYRPCVNGCPPSAQKAARKEVSPQGTWTSSDDSTSYSEWTDGGQQKMMTLHFYHQDNERAGVNAEVIVLGVAAEKSQTDTVWKMLNDIRADTP